MMKDFVLQGFMSRANQQFIYTGSDTAALGVLGIPFRESDPLRNFYNEFVGHAPMRALYILRDMLGIRIGGGSKKFWSKSGIILPIQDWPGRIAGFFCITGDDNRAIYLRKSSGKLILRCRPTERSKHYATIQKACAEGSRYASLNIDINITCDPVLEDDPGMTL